MRARTSASLLVDQVRHMRAQVAVVAQIDDAADLGEREVRISTERVKRLPSLVGSTGRRVTASGAP